jgi:hypothetical protein
LKMKSSSLYPVEPGEWLTRMTQILAKQLPSPLPGCCNQSSSWKEEQFLAPIS